MPIVKNTVFHPCALRKTAATAKIIYRVGGKVVLFAIIGVVT